MNPSSTDTEMLRMAKREIVSINPATMEELGRVPMLNAQDVNLAVTKARSAQPAWAALSFNERAEYILRAKDILLDRQDEICDLIAGEVGKPRVEALAGEVLPVANLMDYFARTAARLLRDEQFTLSVFRNKKSRIHLFPLGVVGIISPWNYPLSIPTGEVVMGLMAGNAVLLKPSEYTPLVGLKIGEIFRAAGLPEGILQVLSGDGATGAALVEAGIDKIFFTGSVRTGRQIAETAARRLMPLVLELGGKDAMIVCADAPFERTVNGALWGAFSNCGQTCASVERLYVVESIAEKFINAVVAKTKTLRVGIDGEQQKDIGSLTNANQLRIVTEQVNDAIAKGARALTGGKRIESLPGYFFEPTVLIDVNDSMRVMQEETFGPVLPIVVVSDEAEAIREANRSNYGLLASVWTKDTKRGQQIAAQVEAGTVIINDVIYTHGAAETPWFGVKESGFGVTHSKHGLREFVQMKHINWDLLPMKTNPWWFPYSEKKRRDFKLLAKVLHKWGLKKWI
ncbi:MAG: aldehyde dehydrogenase family protein [Verrucomicrobiota bacterium]